MYKVIILSSFTYDYVIKYRDARLPHNERYCCKYNIIIKFMESILYRLPIYYYIIIEYIILHVII